MSAANCFDLLPRGSSEGSDIPPDVNALLEEFRGRAKLLSDLRFRDRILNSIGVIKSVNLGTKIEREYDSLPQVLRSRLAQSKFMVGRCVLTRNYFVHGADPKCHLDLVHEMLPFLTDFLEFVFVAADLNRCGWDAQRWLSRDRWRSPVWGFLREYDANLAKYVSAVSSGEPSVDCA